MKAPRQRLLSKIALAFAAALLPVLLLMLWGFRENVRVAEARILNNLLLAADAVAAQVDETFDAAIGLAWAVASDPLCLTLDTPALDKHLTGLIKRVPLFETVAVFDAHGVNRGWGSEAPPRERPNLSETQFFQNVMGANGPVVSEVFHVWKDAPDFGVVAAVPLRSPDDKVVGVVIVVLQPGHLAKWYGENRLQAGQSVFLVDRNARMAFHSDMRRLSFEQGAAFKDFEAIRWALSGISTKVPWYDSPLLHDIRMGAFVPTRGYQWAVGVTIPRAVALAPVRSALGKQLLGFLGVLFLSAVIVGILARHLTLPLSKLRSYALALGRGEHPYPVTLNTRDEVQDLADAIYEMSRRIEDRDADLRKTQERFRITFEQAAVGIAHVAPDGRWLRVNDRLCAILGYSREELLGMRFWDITPPGDRTADEEALGRLTRGQAEWFSFEKRYLRKDGSTVWVNVTLAQARNIEPSEPPYFIKVVEDISPRKQMEADREQLLQKEQSARAAAEAANRAKDQFVAVVSHELRSPLTPALAAIDLLESAPNLDAEQRGDLGIIRGNIEMESRLIGDLLDLTRIQQAKFELHRVPVDVHELLRQVIPFFSTEIREKRLEIQFELRAEPHVLLADPGRLHQVFWNLLGNSVKFTGEHGRIVFSTSVRDEFIRIQVSDNGIGIVPDMVAHVFEAFQQAERTISRRYGGLGLGLTISRALVEFHGGRISVSSNVGEGTTFTVELPLPETPLRGEAAPGAGEAPERRISRRILLVEDSLETLRTLARLLERLGHRVVPAKSAREALDAAREQHFELLLSDIGLPDSTGWELYRELRRANPGLQAIAMSGFGTPEDFQRSRDAGFMGHLVKPIDFKQLKQLIGQLPGGE